MGVVLLTDYKGLRVLILAERKDVAFIQEYFFGRTFEHADNERRARSANKNLFHARHEFNHAFDCLVPRLPRALKDNTILERKRRLTWLHV